MTCIYHQALHLPKYQFQEAETAALSSRSQDLFRHAETSDRRITTEVHYKCSKQYWIYSSLNMITSI